MVAEPAGKPTPAKHLTVDREAESFRLLIGRVLGRRSSVAPRMIDPLLARPPSGREAADESQERECRTPHHDRTEPAVDQLTKPAQPTRVTKAQRKVGMLEAKTHLSALIREVEAGGEVIVLRGKRPVARISRVQSEKPRKSSYGIAKGEFAMSDDFDADSDELADLFGIGR